MDASDVSRVMEFEDGTEMKGEKERRERSEAGGVGRMSCVGVPTNVGDLF